MRILAAQINPVIGDLTGNTKRIIESIQAGRAQSVDLVIFPELALTGYPPEDFILLPHFMEEVGNHLEAIVKESKGIAVIVGLPRYNPHKQEKKLYNSAAFIENSSLIDFADKILLPTYDVFDERRYFEPGDNVKVWELKGEKIGVCICEDLWQHSGVLQATDYRRDPIKEFKELKPSFLINISASPYSIKKNLTRIETCLKAARTLDCPIVLCNQVGGNDSLIFDGRSVYADKTGLLKLAKSFNEDLMIIDLSNKASPINVPQEGLQELYDALVLGVKDYFHKLDFKKGCFGLSGGIDSALVACIAKEALGAENLLALGMPSRFSSSESSRDSKLLSERLGIEYQELSIEDPFESYLSLLAPSFKDKTVDSTEENLQARIRGMILMAFSNKFGYLVLSTGNKSEWALGYSTLYGDMCGGLAVIGDLTKRQVYALAQWINRYEEIIPDYIIQRPPSAELRPNQKDSDSLPPYEMIDQIVESYIEEHRSPAWIAHEYRYPLSLVQDIIRKIHLNEYKRRQGPPVLRVSEKSFSVGRKFPIVQKWV